MRILTKGIVLHKIKYSDNSLIVKTYTEKLGTQSFMVKNAFSKKNKINYLLFAPLAMLELNFDYRKPGQIQYLKEASYYFHFKLIPFDMIRNSILVFYNELLYKMLFNYGEDEKLYRFMEEELILLDSEEALLPDIHIRFIVQLSRLLGFTPIDNFCRNSCFFSINEASFLPVNDPKNTISYEASEYLHHILQYSETGKSMIIPPKIVRNELLQALVRYFEFHHDSIKKIESLDILTQVLN